VSEFDRQATTTKKPLPTGGCRKKKKKVFYFSKVTTSLYCYGGANFATVEEPI
jgi:hypothetical protein